MNEISAENEFARQMKAAFSAANTSTFSYNNDVVILGCGAGECSDGCHSGCDNGCKESCKSGNP